MQATAVWAHMHLIGKEVKVWAELPDGRTERLLWINDWDFNWQDTYLFDEPIFLPARTVIRSEWRYDNTADNPNNPDPDMWVMGGSRTGDEMTHAWLAITQLDDEGYERLVAERKEKEERALAGND